MRCYIDKRSGVLIPGCVGAAVYGRAGCTCAAEDHAAPAVKRADTLEVANGKLEEENERLRRKVERLTALLARRDR